MSYSDAASEQINVQKASSPARQEVNVVRDVERQASRVYINPERPKALGPGVSTHFPYSGTYRRRSSPPSLSELLQQRSLLSR